MKERLFSTRFFENMERENDGKGTTVCIGLLYHLGLASYFLETAGCGEFHVCSGKPYRVVHGAGGRVVGLAAGSVYRAAGCVPE